MFHGIKYLIVSLFFSHLGFWSGNLFLIAPFPDVCLLEPFYDFLAQKDDEMGLFDRFDSCKIIEGFLLGVNTNYRRKGVGSILAGAELVWLWQRN